jgi:hypothetical protein
MARPFPFEANRAQLVTAGKPSGVFAFVSRRNVMLSPATRALMTLAEHHLARRSGRRD